MYKNTFFILCLCLFLLCGCQSQPASGKTNPDGTRNATPAVLTPEADGTQTLGIDTLTIDVSHTDQGYIMAYYTGTADKINIQISGPDGTTYKYFIIQKELYQTLPLTAGNGTYVVAAFENTDGDQYISLFTEVLDVEISDEFLPFLYPNQYVWYTAENKAIAKGAELAEGASDDLEVLSNIYHFVIEHVTYDDEKAASVESGYLPDIDETLDTKKGICFDYAALMTSMLRTQRIPSKLQIGYSGEIKHAWIDVYTEETGWIDKAISFDGTDWTLMDPTFASANEDASEVKDYIGDGSNYTLQYSY